MDFQINLLKLGSLFFEIAVGVLKGGGYVKKIMDLWKLNIFMGNEQIFGKQMDFWLRGWVYCNDVSLQNEFEFTESKWVKRLWNGDEKKCNVK